MAKKANTKAKAETAQPAPMPERIVQQLYITAIDRSPKDVGFWRSALRAAESISNPNECRLFDLYEDILLDLYLKGIIRKRISQVVNKKLLFLADGKPVDPMENLIISKVFKDVMKQYMWSKFKGLSGMEFVPGDKLAFNKIPPKHIKRSTQIISRTQNSLTDGVSYADKPNIIVISDEDNLGLLLLCGFIVLLKKGTISDWAQYIEIFGSPAIVLKYAGYDTQARKSAEKIIQNIGNSMRMAIPNEMGLTFEDGKQQNGDGKLHNTFRQACNEELAIGILGNTETTGHSGTGTGAKSTVHADQQMEIIKEDMDDLCDFLNSDAFINILRSYNYPVDGGRFVFAPEVDIKMLKDFQPIFLSFIHAGLPVSKDSIYETFGIPKPKEGEELLVIPSAEPETEEPPAFPKRTTKKKPAEAPVTRGEINAMLKDFFGPARS